MLSINPRDYLDPIAIKSIEQFYKEMLRGQGIKVSNVNVTPFHISGTMIGNATSTPIRTVKDITSLEQANIGINFTDPSVAAWRRVFHGSMSTTVFNSGSLSAWQMEAGFMSGENSDLLANGFSYTRRRYDGGSNTVDDIYNGNIPSDTYPVPDSGNKLAMFNQWNDIAFRMPYLLVTGVAGQQASITMKYTFAGVKIEF